MMRRGSYFFIYATWKTQLRPFQKLLNEYIWIVFSFEFFFHIFVWKIDDKRRKKNRWFLWFYTVFFTTSFSHFFFLVSAKVEFALSGSSGGGGTVWHSSIFRRASAAFVDIKILQTAAETTLCKGGPDWKAFEMSFFFFLFYHPSRGRGRMRRCSASWRQWPSRREPLCVERRASQLRWIFVSLKAARRPRCLHCGSRPRRRGGWWRWWWWWGIDGGSLLIFAQKI